MSTCALKENDTVRLYAKNKKEKNIKLAVGAMYDIVKIVLCQIIHSLTSLTYLDSVCAKLLRIVQFFFITTLHSELNHKGDAAFKTCDGEGNNKLKYYVRLMKYLRDFVINVIIYL